MGYRVVNAEVLERKAEQAVFYQEPTLHGTLFWALRGSLEQKEVWSPELLGVLEPKDKLRYKLFHSDPPALKLRWEKQQVREPDEEGNRPAGSRQPVAFHFS